MLIPVYQEDYKQRYRWYNLDTICIELPHLRPKSSVQRVPPGAVLQYGEDGTELISRFGAKSPEARQALLGLNRDGADAVRGEVA